MLTPHPYLQFLPAVLVLLWPFRVVFSVYILSVSTIHASSPPDAGFGSDADLLQDLAIFDDAFDLLDHEGGDTHCQAVSAALHKERTFGRGGRGAHTLFPDQGVVAVVGVVGVACYC